MFLYVLCEFYASSNTETSIPWTLGSKACQIADSIPSLLVIAILFREVGGLLAGTRGLAI